MYHQRPNTIWQDSVDYEPPLWAEVGASFVPGLDQAMAVRDMERARQAWTEKNYLLAGMNGLAAVPGIGAIGSVGRRILKKPEYTYSTKPDITPKKVEVEYPAGPSGVKSRVSDGPTATGDQWYSDNIWHGKNNNQNR
jgi:hypothetical protein